MSFYFGVYNFKFHTSKTNNGLRGDSKANSSSAQSPSGTQAGGSATAPTTQAGGTTNQGGTATNGQSATQNGGTAPATQPTTNQPAPQPQDIKLVQTNGGYELTVDGASKGQITIPSDKHLKDVKYEEGSKSLKFTLDIDGTDKEIDVPLEKLSDSYEKGNGLELTDKTFSIKLSQDSEPFLTVTDEGVKLKGIQEQLDKKLNIDEATANYAPITLVDKVTALEGQIGTKADGTSVKVYTGENGVEVNDTKISLSTDFQGLPTKVTDIEKEIKTLAVKADVDQAIETAKQGAKQEAIADAEAKYVKKTEEKTFELESQGLTHTLKFGGQTVGTIDIPKDLLVTKFEYDDVAKEIKITTNDVAGTGQDNVLKINVSDLVNIYNAKVDGGLVLEGNEFALATEYKELPKKVEDVENRVLTLEGMDAVSWKLNGVQSGNEYPVTTDPMNNLIVEIDVPQPKTYEKATEQADGLMSKEHFAKMQELEAKSQDIAIKTEVTQAITEAKNEVLEAVEKDYEKKSAIVAYSAGDGLELQNGAFKVIDSIFNLPQVVDQKLGKQEAEDKYAQKSAIGRLEQADSVINANHKTLSEKYDDLSKKYETLLTKVEQMEQDIQTLRQGTPVMPVI